MKTEIPIVLKEDFTTVRRIPETVRYSEDMVPAILEAQEMDLLPVFTKDMKADLIATIENLGVIVGTEGYNQAAYDGLLPYLKDVALWYGFSRYNRTAGIDYTRSGPVVKSGTPNSEPIGKGLRDTLVQGADSKAAHYLREMCEYLDDNSTSFPDWSPPSAISPGRKGISFSSVGRNNYRTTY